MPKRTKKNRYAKKGGDIITQAPPVGQGLAPMQAPSAFSSWFNDAKKAVSSAANSVSSAASSATNSIKNTVSPPPQILGGRRRRKGGKTVAILSTAKPQVWVGGKKMTCHKRHKHTKSCKSQTYKKGNRRKHSRKSKFSFSKSLKRLIKM